MPVDTNIIIFELDDRLHAGQFVQKLASHGIKCNTFGHQLIRFVQRISILLLQWLTKLSIH